MKRNNFSRLNTSKFESHLSSFGRQVLETLIKQWSPAPVPCETAVEHNLNNSTQFHHPNQQNYSNRRVITFGEPNIRANNLLDAAVNSEPILEDRFVFPPSANFASSVPAPCTRAASAFPLQSKLAAPSIFQATPNLSKPSAVTPDTAPQSSFLMPVPTSAELVTAAVTSNDDQSSFSRDDLITSADRNTINNERDQFMDLAVDNVVNGYLKSDNALHVARLGLKRDSLGKEVDWDNMFDTELLSELDPPINEIVESVDSVEPVTNDLVYNMQLPYNNSSSTLAKPKKDKNHTEMENNIDVQKSKRKNQCKVTDIMPKKVNKIKPESKSKSKALTKSKNSFTQSFHDWLNDVDPNNPVADLQECLEIQKQSTSIIHQHQKTSTSVKDNTRTAEKLPKKIVQAQLANKGGKMKFGKPNKNIFEKTVEDTKSDEVLPETNIKDQEKVKEKKPKSKFVAPIKSQKPVKDVTYEIHGVNEANVTKLTELRDQEIVALLLYSNGFCQLNSHHTEDVCVPEAIIFHLQNSFFYFKEDEKDIADILSKMLQNNVIICYDGKSLLNYLKIKMKLEFNLICTFKIIDIKIGGSLLEPDCPPETFSALQRLASSETEFTIATTCVKQKTAWYATLLRDVASAVRNRLELENLWDIFVDIEMPIVPIIADMEHRGVSVDMDKLKEMEKILVSKMKQVEAECMGAAGRTFQINSTVQVRALLYDELRLDEKAGLKVRGTFTTGAKSTSESMLKSLVSVHPLPRLILEYRHLHKAHATFVLGVAQYVRGGVVRPVWVQTAAATGRIASSNPNLQAIPKVPFKSRLFPENREKAEQEETLRFRCVYVARAEHVLLAADWRHVECRVFARAAADTQLTRALEAPDLFRTLAANWLQKPEEAVSPADRERTKRIVYASLYGAGARKLMEILDVDYSQALGIAASFDRTFPSLRSFGRRVAAECLASGGRVATLCGRARALPRIASADPAQRAHAERQALNFIVQGSAADVCKLAMSQATRGLETAGLRARILLQIHDELVWEVHHSDLRAAAEVIRSAMERCGARVGLPSLPVALAVGPSWGQLEPYQPYPYQPSNQSNEQSRDWDSQEFEI